MIIKFRNWDIQEKKYTYSGNVAYTPSDRFIVEQFTGCYDADGTEIYEGDIVDLKCDAFPWGDVENVIRHKSGGFAVSEPNEKISATFLYAFDSNCRVIGNIRQGLFSGDLWHDWLIKHNFEKENDNDYRHKEFVDFLLCNDEYLSLSGLPEFEIKTFHQMKCIFKSITGQELKTCIDE